VGRKPAAVRREKQGGSRGSASLAVQARQRAQRRIGLHPAGWKVGQSLQELRGTASRAWEWRWQGIADHTVIRSLYLRDPDDNKVELCVDDPGADRRNQDERDDESVPPLRR
jgi:catechol-2,3-dioxygenase